MASLEARDRYLHIRVFSETTSHRALSSVCWNQPQTEQDSKKAKKARDASPVAQSVASLPTDINPGPFVSCAVTTGA